MIPEPVDRRTPPARMPPVRAAHAEPPGGARGRPHHILVGGLHRQVEDRGEPERLGLGAVARWHPRTGRTRRSSRSWRRWRTRPARHGCCGTSPSAGFRSPDESPIVNDPDGTATCSTPWRDRIDRRPLPRAILAADAEELRTSRRPARARLAAAGQSSSPCALGYARYLAAQLVEARSRCLRPDRAGLAVRITESTHERRRRSRRAPAPCPRRHGRAATEPADRP